jgi:curved DNA-binding protein CbpA
MADPYQVLGLAPDSDDATIRRRYLELVRQFPPDRNAEKFAAVRTAYECLRDLPTRIKYRLFEAGKNESIDSLIEEAACRNLRRPVSLQTIILAVKSP